jgi:hypothetical protein
MLIRILSALLFLSVTEIGATDLGKPLAFKMKPSGAPSFGVVYTYNGDPDGTSYMLTFSSKLSPTEGARQLRWNYYQKSTYSFLLSWSKNRVTSLAIFQVLLKDEKLAGTIEKMIKAQKGGKNEELFFVLADDNNTPIYYISLSELCSKYPDNFNDMSHSRSCDNPKL